MTASDWLLDGAVDAPLTVALAHGAGAPMDTPFMNWFASGLAAAGYRVVRFEFPYMYRRRAEGVRAGPDRSAVLEGCWRSVVTSLDRAPGRVVIGGKSMGGRIATLVADDLGVAGLLCLGYPFHPAGKPDRLRVDPLRALATPCLIAQGERDPMGNRAEVGGYPLADSVQLHWLDDGDHSFKPRKRSGRTEEQNLSSALSAAEVFLAQLSR